MSTSLFTNSPKLYFYMVKIFKYCKKKRGKYFFGIFHTIVVSTSLDITSSHLVETTSNFFSLIVKIFSIKMSKKIEWLYDINYEANYLWNVEQVMVDLSSKETNCF